MPVIHVSAALLSDRHGRLLLVRKKGTSAFMQPGGKPEPGESALDATIREVGEEVGLRVAAERWRALGQFRAAAANEPGHEVIADAFAVELSDAEVAGASPAAEIAAATWVTPVQALELDLAPLTRDRLLPLLQVRPD